MDSRLNDQDIWASVRRLALDRRITRYSILQQILLVGEGDFSFSLALANAFGSADNMVATSLNSREKIRSSYESGQNNLQNLEKRGAMILHGVDATTMNKLEIMRERRFDRIVFNFPHAGFFGNEKDNKVIKKHRHLLNMFFKNGMTMLNKMGEIHVTHKEGDPYDKWKLVEEAEKCGLLLKKSVNFEKADYPGYTNRRGAGPNIGETFFLGECRTYMFVLRFNDQMHSAPPKISSQGHLEILKAAILELETERQNRKAAETAKANLESSFTDLSTVADKALNERDDVRRQKYKALRKKAEITKQKEKIGKELHEALRLNEEIRRQRDNALHQKDQVCREKENVSKQLAEALRLKEDAAMERDVSVLDLESERKARIDAESARDEALKERDEFISKNDEALREKAMFTKQLAEAFRLKEDAAMQRDVSVLDLESERKARIDAESARDETLKERDVSRRQRDNALHQKDQICREKENITKQLAEALRLKEDAVNQRDKSILDLKFERKYRVDAQYAKADLEFRFNGLKTVVDETSEERDEFRRKNDEALQAKANITTQLVETLRLKENAVMQRDATIRDLAIERKARKDVENEKANLEFSFNELRTVVNKILKERDEFKSKQDEALREKENITKQLVEALRFKEDTLKQKRRGASICKFFVFCIFLYFCIGSLPFPRS